MHIRPIGPRDRAQWEDLYAGQLLHHGKPDAPRILRVVWSWLHDPSHVLEGLVAERGGALAGLAHYRPCPSPGRGCEVGFIDDLYTHPNHRRQGVSRALLGEIRGIAARRGWPMVRLITDTDNTPARGLYDAALGPARWVSYRMDA